MTNTQHLNSSNPISIRLSKSVPEHILVDETALCDAEADSEESRLLDADADPLSESSIHLCPECADDWLESGDALPRATTVRCLCDRIEEAGVYKCGTVVPATEARALKHPDTEQTYVPICPDCYEWLRDRPTSPVTLPYDEVKSFSAILDEE